MYPELTPEEHEQALNNIRGRKFDCDVCGATVDGEWLELHSRWHDEQSRVNAVLAKLITSLRPPGTERRNTP